MDILQNVFGNKAIQNLAFGKLKTTMKENNLSGILVLLHNDEELDFKFLQAELELISKDELEQLKKDNIEMRSFINSIEL